MRASSPLRVSAPPPSSPSSATSSSSVSSSAAAAVTALEAAEAAASDAARGRVVDTYAVLERLQAEAPCQAEVASFGPEAAAQLTAREELASRHLPVLEELEALFAETYAVDARIAARVGRLEALRRRGEGRRHTAWTRRVAEERRMLLQVEVEALRHRGSMLCAYVERRLVGLVREAAPSRMLPILRRQRDRRLAAEEARQAAAAVQEEQQQAAVSARKRPLPSRRTAAVHALRRRKPPVCRLPTTSQKYLLSSDAFSA